MKGLAVFFFMFAAFAAEAQTVRSNTLLAKHYDVAEFVIRQYMTPESDRVFHLDYGTNEAPMPVEFMTRFKGQTPLVRGTPDGITVVSNKIVLDEITRKEAVGLSIREITVSGDTAEVQVIYFASYTSNSTRFYLVRENGKWRVKERKVERIACG